MFVLCDYFFQEAFVGTELHQAWCVVLSQYKLNEKGYRLDIAHRKCPDISYERLNIPVHVHQ